VHYTHRVCVLHVFSTVVWSALVFPTESFSQHSLESRCVTSLMYKMWTETECFCMQSARSSWVHWHFSRLSHSKYIERDFHHNPLLAPKYTLLVLAVFPDLISWYFIQTAVFGVKMEELFLIYVKPARTLSSIITSEICSSCLCHAKCVRFLSWRSMTCTKAVFQMQHIHSSLSCFPAYLHILMPFLMIIYLLNFI
jgi:hypothetical protein